MRTGLISSPRRWGRGIKIWPPSSFQNKGAASPPGNKPSYSSLHCHMIVMPSPHHATIVILNIRAEWISSQRTPERGIGSPSKTKVRIQLLGLNQHHVIILHRHSSFIAWNHIFHHRIQFLGKPLIRLSIIPCCREVKISKR